MNGIIYVIKNSSNGKLYVGSTSRPKKRKYEHFYFLKLNKHPNRYLQFAYNGMPDNFSFIELEFLKNTNEKKLLEREQYWMDYYKSYEDQYGYNLNPIAENGNHVGGWKHTEEWKLEMSQIKAGRKMPLGFGEKISSILKGRSSEKKGILIISRELRICVCGCNKQFECKINSKQRFIPGHNSLGNIISLPSQKGIKRTPEQCKRISLAHLGKGKI